VPDRAKLQQLLDALLVQRLGAFLEPLGSKEVAAIAVRVLTAASLHDSVGATLLRDGVLPLLLGRLGTAADGLAILIVALFHNLADSSANCLRLLAAGTLCAVTRLILEPVSSATLKEHCVTAAASMAGCAAEEVSFPQVVGRLCASRLPGTQREALSSLELIANVATYRAQLPQVADVVSGLRAACRSRDATVSSQARTLLQLLGLGEQ